MPGPPASSTAPRPSTAKRKRSEQGWAHRKAGDARHTAEHYEGQDAPVRPHYTLGTVDEKQLQIHLDPPIPKKFAEASLERFRGSLVRALCAQWPAAAVVQLHTDKLRGGHWSQALWRAQLGRTRAPEPFVSVMASNYATTQ